MDDRTPVLKDNTQNTASKAPFHNWQLYAAATGATLAMSSSAQAAILYGTVGQTISIATTGNDRKTATFQLPIHGGTRFTAENFALGRTSVGGSVTGYARVTGFFQFATTHGKTAGGGRAAKNFAFGSLIGPLVPVTGGGGTFIQKNDNSGVRGAFQGVQTGFLGLNSGFGDYGWLRIRVSDAGTPGYTNSITIIDYAFDTTGSPIPAGFGAPTPEPGTKALALLALGASGLLAWRRRRDELNRKSVPVTHSAK